jgi:CubicO group peptidase (beta-lactamase class C family)
LVNTIPSHSHGTLAYHPHEYGWILSEIVVRVDGRTLPDFFAEEIGIALNLPALRFGLADRDMESFAFSYWLGKKKVMVAGRNVAEEFEEQNGEQFFSANNPAVSLVSDAVSLAGFYDFLLMAGMTTDGQQLISADTIKRYTARTTYSWDRSLNTPLAVGRGFVVGTTFPSSFGWWRANHCFGHAGGFSCLAFGDYDTNISVAIITNGNRGLFDIFRRFVPIAHGLRLACRK